MDMHKRESNNDSADNITNPPWTPRIRHFYIVKISLALALALTWMFLMIPYMGNIAKILGGITVATAAGYRLAMAIIKRYNGFVLVPAGKLVFITCGDNDVGFSTAKRCTKLGFSVIVGVRDVEADHLHVLKACRVELVEVNPNSESSMDAASIRVKKLLLEKGLTLHGIVYNNGLTQLGEIEWLNPPDFSSALNSAVAPVVQVCHNLLDHLRGDSERIVICAGFTGRIGIPGTAVDSVVNAALTAFADVLRREMMKFPIHVVLVEPYWACYRNLQKPDNVDAMKCLSAESQAIKNKQIYGENYLDRFQDIWSDIADENSNSNNEKTAAAIIMALTDCPPSIRYICGPTIKSSLNRLLEYMPDYMVDTILFYWYQPRWNNGNVISNLADNSLSSAAPKEIKHKRKILSTNPQAKTAKESFFKPQTSLPVPITNNKNPRVYTPLLQNKTSTNSPENRQICEPTYFSNQRSTSPQRQSVVDDNKPQRRKLSKERRRTSKDSTRKAAPSEAKLPKLTESEMAFEICSILKQVESPVSQSSNAPGYQLSKADALTPIEEEGAIAGSSPTQSPSNPVLENSTMPNLVNFDSRGFVPLEPEYYNNTTFNSAHEPSTSAATHQVSLTPLAISNLPEKQGISSKNSTNIANVNKTIVDHDRESMPAPDEQNINKLVALLDTAKPAPDTKQDLVSSSPVSLDACSTSSAADELEKLKTSMPRLKYDEDRDTLDKNITNLHPSNKEDNESLDEILKPAKTFVDKMHSLENLNKMISLNRNNSEINPVLAPEQIQQLLTHEQTRPSISCSREVRQNKSGIESPALIYEKVLSKSRPSKLSLADKENVSKRKNNEASSGGGENQTTKDDEDVFKEIAASFELQKPDTIQSDIPPAITTEKNSEFKPEMKLEVTPEVKLQVTSEAKLEVAPEVKLEIKPEVKLEITPEVRPEIKLDTNLEIKPEIVEKLDTWPAIEKKPDVNPTEAQGPDALAKTTNVDPNRRSSSICQKASEFFLSGDNTVPKTRGVIDAFLNKPSPDFSPRRQRRIYSPSKVLNAYANKKTQYKNFDRLQKKSDDSLSIETGTTAQDVGYTPSATLAPYYNLPPNTATMETPLKDSDKNIYAPGEKPNDGKDPNKLKIEPVVSQPTAESKQIENPSEKSIYKTVLIPDIADLTENTLLQKQPESSNVAKPETDKILLSGLQKEAQENPDSKTIVSLEAPILNTNSQNEKSVDKTLSQPSIRGQLGENLSAIKQHESGSKDVEFGTDKNLPTEKTIKAEDTQSIPKDGKNMLEEKKDNNARMFSDRADKPSELQKSGNECIDGTTKKGTQLEKENRSQPTSAVNDSVDKLRKNDSGDLDSAVSGRAKLPISDSEYLDSAMGGATKKPAELEKDNKSQPDSTLNGLLDKQKKNDKSDLDSAVGGIAKTTQGPKQTDLSQKKPLVPPKPMSLSGNKNDSRKPDLSFTSPTLDAKQDSNYPATIGGGLLGDKFRADLVASNGPITISRADTTFGERGRVVQMHSDTTVEVPSKPNAANPEQILVVELSGVINAGLANPECPPLELQTRQYYTSPNDPSLICNQLKELEKGLNSKTLVQK